MQMNEQVLTALEVLKDCAENDFERHRIDVLISDLTAPIVPQNLICNLKNFPRIIDLTGQKFGKLTVIGYAGKKNNRTRWLCKCECGNLAIVDGNSLKTNHTESCGCLHYNPVANPVFANSLRYKHGMSHTKVYQTWSGIKQRCYNKNAPNYYLYGGRGITMYTAWIDDPAAFCEYVSQLEHFGEKGYTLDRIDVNGNYEPGNLRWSTSIEQNRNTRKNVKVIYKGEEMTLAEAAEKSGIHHDALRSRIRKGEVTEELLFRPVKHKN